MLLVAACDYSIVEQDSPNPTGPGGGSSVSIVVTPGAATVRPGGNTLFRAIVTGATDTSVTWSIVSGPGAIYHDGRFIAPDDQLGTTTVRARANADTTKSATATVTITNDGGGSQVVVTVSPATASLEPGKTQQFSATVAGSPNTAVTWSTSGPGTVSATGLYTAPPTIPTDPTSVVIQATSVVDPTAIARATVTISMPVDPNRICFDREIAPIFSSNCAMSGCHDRFTRKHGYNFETAAGIRSGVIPFDSHESEIYEMITGKGDDDPDEDDIMPPPPRKPLSAAQIDLIRRWIDAGADTTACPPPTGACDTVNVTYSATIRTIIDNNCIGCHTGGSSYNRNVDLSTHAGVQRVAMSGQLAGAISHAAGFTPMPFQRPKLDDCTIAKMKAWIGRGARND